MVDVVRVEDGSLLLKADPLSSQRFIANISG